MSTMAAASSSVDFNMEDMITLNEQDFYSPSSASPSTSKMLPSQPIINPQANFDPSQRTYSGPSHDYSQFKQQTGLPSGAISNVTGSEMQDVKGNYQFGGGFDQGYSHFDGFTSGDPQQNFFFGADGMGGDEYVDPTVIDGQQYQPQPAQRAWPGMHSQQAEQQARAQNMIRQRQQQQQHRRQSSQPQQQAPAQQHQLLLQQQLPNNFEQTFGNTSESGQQSNTGGSERHVDERISQLLNQIRHNSNASTLQDIDEDAEDEGMSASQRKKAEEEMDEDERLLASEEGKKLTSKERRQLRNKVSARAFRSRRKEYITQLEGEVATKANEVNDLKARNRTLLAQNQQLMELSQTMLNHPGFSSFMQDISQDPSLLDRLKPQGMSQDQSSQASNSDTQSIKQEPMSAQPTSATTENTTHVGMTMIPEHDFNNLNLGGGNNTHFQPAHSAINPSMFGGYQNAQVFAVTEVPTPCTNELFNPAALSGKLIPEDDLSMDEVKATSPVFDDDESPFQGSFSVVKSQSKPADAIACDLEEQDPAYELYCSSSERDTQVSEDTVIAPRSGSLEGINEKGRYELVVIGGASVQDVDSLFASVENSSAVKRIGQIMGGHDM